MSNTRTRSRLVEPLGSRGSRIRKTIDGEKVQFRPTVDSLLKDRKKRKANKNRVVIRLKR